MLVSISFFHVPDSVCFPAGDDLRVRPYLCSAFLVPSLATMDKLMSATCHDDDPATTAASTAVRNNDENFAMCVRGKEYVGWGGKE
jgi:hypothetical protein